MAKGYIQTLLNALPAEVRPILLNAFDYVQSSWRLGTGARATNAQWFRISGTTSSNANTEFSILHGMDVAPATLIPVLDLNAVNSQLVPLTVSKAPDTKRVYLTSSSTGAVITVYVE